MATFCCFKVSLSPFLTGLSTHPCVVELSFRRPLYFCSPCQSKSKLAFASDLIMDAPTDLAKHKYLPSEGSRRWVYRCLRSHMDDVRCKAARSANKVRRKAVQWWPIPGITSALAIHISAAAAVRSPKHFLNLPSIFFLHLGIAGIRNVIGPVTPEQHPMSSTLFPGPVLPKPFSPIVIIARLRQSIRARIVGQYGTEQ